MSFRRPDLTAPGGAAHYSPQFDLRNCYRYLLTHTYKLAIPETLSDPRIRALMEATECTTEHIRAAMERLRTAVRAMMVPYGLRAGPHDALERAGYFEVHPVAQLILQAALAKVFLCGVWGAVTSTKLELGEVPFATAMTALDTELGQILADYERARQATT